MIVGTNLINALYDFRTPESRAYTIDGEAWRTTAELRTSVARMARALELSGVEAGDRVSFKLPKSEEVLFLAHACLQLGAILHPLNTAYTDAEISYLVEDARPRIFVCPPEEKARFSLLLGVSVLTLGAGMAGSLGERMRDAAPREEITKREESDTAALLYTSGTTGKPKGACITHGNLASSARALAEVWSISGSDCLLHPLPLYHAHGLLTSINTMLVGSASIRFIDGFQLDDVIPNLARSTVLMGVPTHYSRLLSDNRLAEATKALRLAISGSAPLSSEIAARFQGVTGVPIIERYGATETAIVTAVPASKDDRSGWVGWALPGVEIRVEHDGVRHNRSATGSLETRGHNVFGGYWNQQSANQAAFTPDGWFITGDVAEIDETGCVRLLGRNKDIIITGGLNVYPKEVEDALDALLSGGEAAVFGVAHPDFGEAVVAAVERMPASENEATLQTALRVVLAPYKVPKRILAIDTIPRNRMGKVLKNELRDTHRGLFTSGEQQRN